MNHHEAIINKAEIILKKEMILELRELLGSGYVPDYYANIAQGFVSIAVAEIKDALKEAYAALPSEGGIVHVMSQDHERLYHHLCNGGEAHANMMVDQFGPRKLSVMLSSDGTSGYTLETFVAECQRTSLEWIAPVSAKDIAETIMRWYENTMPHDRNSDSLCSRLSSELNIQ